MESGPSCPQLIDRLLRARSPWSPALYPLVPAVPHRPHRQRRHRHHESPPNPGHHNPLPCSRDLDVSTLFGEYALKYAEFSPQTMIRLMQCPRKVLIGVSPMFTTETDTDHPPRSTQVNSGTFRS